MKPYVKVILILSVFVLWAVFMQISNSTDKNHNHDIGCGSGNCTVTPESNTGSQ